MVAKRVVVVFKPIEPDDRLVASRALDAPPTEPADPALDAIAARRALARSEHAASVEAVRLAVNADGLDAVVTDTVTSELVADADLVIAVGGDGTFLHVARLLEDQPLLGVNSAPSTSQGHYCAATSETLGGWLEAGLDGGESSALTRISVTVDDRPLPYMALNDVLFANVSPAASTRYALRVGEVAELQLSSGIWIATASGSSAAISSAGGDLMAADDERLQFLVREPCADRDGGPHLRHGYSDAITLVSRSDHNALYFDGHHRAWPTPLGTLTRLSPAPRPLRVVGYPGARP